MRRTRGRTVDIVSLADLDRRLAAGAPVARGLARARARPAGARRRAGPGRRRGCGLRGLHCSPTESTLRDRGAVVLTGLPARCPSTPTGPRSTPRGSSTTPRGTPTPSTPASMPGRRLPRHRDASLAMALHDHAIDTALETWVRDREPGRRDGRARADPRQPRTSPPPRGSGTALGSSYVVATGGGPGAMEAANLGALLSRGGPGPARRGPATCWRGCRLPRRTSAPGWPRRWRSSGRSPTRPATLGIPTWHYGHEPSNAFATAIAKYFRNATREAILLQVCAAGIVFLPGAAGTVQEVFQDACENYYADASSLAPMVLVGRSTGPRPCRRGRCCATLARGRAMEPHVHLVDTLDEAAGGPRRADYSAAASCPQAPSISRPRVSRTVVGMPLASSRRTNSRSSAGSEAVHFEPGVGLSGIRLTCTQPQSP